MSDEKAVVTQAEEERRQQELKEQYPTLMEFSVPLKAAERKIVGREREISQVMAGMARPELANLILLAEAGTGKTALVQAAMLQDAKRSYLEVDLARMISGLSTPDEMAALLKSLFDEAEAIVRDTGTELVLFIDEFHQVVQLSAAAVEALKPVLAASGTRGLRVIAATTYDEFNQHISPNQPLVERLQRINVSPPNQQITVEILKGMAKRYGVADQFLDDHLFELIYEYTNRYIPAQSQPRKSIAVLDSMVGWHRSAGREMDKTLLADVLMESTNVNVAFRVDAQSIREELDKRVYAQQLATSSVARRLQICVADLHDKTKPMSSFLFTGSTGTGKGVLHDEPILVKSKATGEVSFKRAIDLVAGEDLLFTRRGTTQELLGTFPQSKQDVYEVALNDGRSLVTDGAHLWGLRSARQKDEEGLTILSTKTIYERMNASKTLRGVQFGVPAAEAVELPERELPVAPYAMGAFLAGGLLSPSMSQLVLSVDDERVVARVAEGLGASEYSRRVLRVGEDPETSDAVASWLFGTGELARNGARRLHKEDVFAGMEGVIDTTVAERRIPAEYLLGSIEQRWDLLHGLFDVQGRINDREGGFAKVTYGTSSTGLARDISRLLFSLGVVNTISTKETDTGSRSTVRLRVDNIDKPKFFTSAQKKDVAEAAAMLPRQRSLGAGYSNITSVVKLDEQAETVCFFVADEEHLFLAGESLIVTHNTELTKQLAQLLFGDDQRHLVRFDMSEYALNDSVDRFRVELTRRVWAMGHAVLLFDEIEKAAGTVTRVLLQVLDDGRLTDPNGRQVSFLNTYIILTTNAGSEVYKTISEYSVSDTGDGSNLLRRLKEIRTSIMETVGENKFPPELMGRIDALVPFQPLSRATQRRIVLNKLGKIRQEVYAKHGVRMKVDDRVINYLIDDKADVASDEGGARAIVSKMNDEVVAAVASFINEHPTERVISVLVDGELRTENKNLLMSDAFVYVVAEH